jgi:hypothetical protein
MGYYIRVLGKELDNIPLDVAMVNTPSRMGEITKTSAVDNR